MISSLQDAVEYVTDVFSAHPDCNGLEARMAAVRGKPILLNIGQEIYDEEPFAFIRRDLDLYREHRAITFNYTGMNWRRCDRPMIREVHRRLDEYWTTLVG
ncbi:MAG: hypothetical protein A3K19_11035 [Lentisphaerae bacterium RIFOXYB12_FULL_65_16]|nr:MAG: hypothetical protein A3K18_15095 [Lentisphaerae bacterium RIFOXYA12_64_32]OGV94364.1 MAG: hypothetical protein A3K19_11035 [Lentisphaerae bacterium RIFOXYB12_FULL_65_16]